MIIRMAGTAALAVALCVMSAARAADLTLDDAFRRAIAFHPELRQLATQRELLEVERTQVALKPALEAGLEVENVLGSGDFQGIQAAEFTLNLGSVLERGGKRPRRQDVAEQHIAALRTELDARTLDLLAEVARRFAALVAAEHLHGIAVDETGLRERTVELARARLAAGAAPEATVLASEAALARAVLARLRADQRRDSARQYLAALWNERSPDFTIPIDELLLLPPVEPMGSLAAALQRSPELAGFATERRVREARLRLARSAATPDLRWQVGLRRLEASNDFAVVAGVSVPLGARNRADPQIRAATVELAGLDVDFEAAEASLYATLVQAHGRYSAARREVLELQSEVLPRLVRAEAATAAAYRAGASSFTEWVQLQAELTDTSVQQVEAALDGHLALIEMQRLTGQSFLATDVAATGDAP